MEVRVFNDVLPRSVKSRQLTSDRDAPSPELLRSWNGKEEEVLTLML